MFALRAAATATGHSLLPVGLRARLDAWRPVFDVVGTAKATLAPVGSACPTVAFGAISRVSEAPALAEFVSRYRRHFGEFVFVVDGTPAQAMGVMEMLGPLAQGVPVKVVGHALGGNFSRQRNLVQSNASKPWVLQLDTDELLEDTALESLDWLVSEANRWRLRSIAFPRINLVDGEKSNHFPDVQYRLNRADVRYINEVHETPQLPWWKTLLALTGAIEHRLERARVLARSVQYEAMQGGAGRPHDERLLLEPYDSGSG